MVFVLMSVRVPVPAGHGHPLQAGLLATLAASLFGLSLFAGARAIEQVPELWLPAGSRTFGTVLIALPLALLGHLPRPGRFLRFVFYSALAQSTGYFAFLVAADSSGISVPAVLASQASVVGMVISFLVLGERLSRPPAGGHRSPPDRRRARRGDPLRHMFVGVLLATFTAFTWGSISVLEARVSRALGGQSALAWIFGVGLVVILPIALDPRHPGRERGRMGAGRWSRPSARWPGSR